MMVSRAFGTVAAWLVGVILLVGCSSTEPPECRAGGAIAGYTLGPSDRIRLTVFRHEDLSGEFELDGEGLVAVPLAGEMLAQNLTARQLEDGIERRLTEHGFLIKPQVGVEIVAYRPFYILGEIGSPGEYEYASGLTVVRGVSIAGGFTYRAKQSDIMIERDTHECRAKPNTQLLPDDIVRVGERFF
jgi:polysaccharide export outer membrane protein